MNIPPEVRVLVRERTKGWCEYCTLPERASVVAHQIDHIIGRQHYGSDHTDNLCLCCIRCNLKKGPNIASIDPETRLVTALYHPRQQSWNEHFHMSHTRVVGLTAAGRATVRLLEMNDEERLRLRRALAALST